ncbi:MAG: methyltransferase domain-containing protein [Prevotellaceae bacterium]|nr:methyltransferase domain-containing protein [Prevotellaceae bacterium]
MPYGYVHSRENALCPSCLSLERHRLMWLYLKNKTDFFSKRYRLLHIAPERCFIRSFKKLLGDEYVTADLESPWATIKMDVQNIPCGENEFDVIFCNHLLEHVADDRQAMREMFRVLRPGGWGIMLSPVTAGKKETYEDPSITSPKERLKAYGQSDHLREYGEDYPNRLAEAGFKVQTVDYAKELPETEVCASGLRSEKIYVVKK